MELIFEPSLGFGNAAFSESLLPCAVLQFRVIFLSCALCGQLIDPLLFVSKLENWDLVFGLMID